MSLPSYDAFGLTECYERRRNKYIKYAQSLATGTVHNIKSIAAGNTPVCDWSYVTCLVVQNANFTWNIAYSSNEGW